MIIKKDLEKHWWFRVLKVVYIFLMGFLVIVVITLAINERPFLDKSSSTYQIKCLNNRSLMGNINGKDLYYLNNKLAFISDKETQLSRFLCMNSEIKQYDINTINILFTKASIKQTIPSMDNFEILIKTPVYNKNWLASGLYLFGGIIAIILIGLFLKMIFLYIITGDNLLDDFFDED